MVLNSNISELEDTDLWQEAQERVLLYLKRLGMPAMLSLEIAEKALHQAVQARQNNRADLPIQLAMRALHGVILSDIDVLRSSAYKEYPIIYRRWHWSHNKGTDSQTSTGLRTEFEPSASPPINRGFITIKKL
jgi:hypothetical protein